LQKYKKNTNTARQTAEIKSFSVKAACPRLSSTPRDKGNNKLQTPPQRYE
jgi:hypothetical protein